MQELPPEENLHDVVDLQTLSDQEREFVENFLIYANHLDAIGSKKHITINFAGIEAKHRADLNTAIANRGADMGVALSKVLSEINKKIVEQLADADYIQVIAFQRPTINPKELQHVDYSGEYAGIKPGKLFTNWDDVVNKQTTTDNKPVLDENGRPQYVPRFVIKIGKDEYACVPITTIMAIFKVSNPRHGMHLV
jgi:hypothetical protein